MEWFQGFLNGLIESYSTFFSVDQLMQVVTDPVSWTIIGTLVVLEGLLSADNALVLAVMVKHLPKDQQKKALFYGIVGAYIFRFIAIGFGVFLVKIWWIKVAGGLYLLWMALSYFIKKPNDGDDEIENKPRSFWKTVLAVEVMDIAFSIDSVLAAFGVSDKIWVLFLGGILGVLMMRGVAQVFLALIERVPELETTAFILIGLIGTKMVAGAFGYHVGEFVFFTILIATFLATFIVSAFRKKGKANK